jgi:hypothetical protein
MICTSEPARASPGTDMKQWNSSSVFLKLFHVKRGAFDLSDHIEPVCLQKDRIESVTDERRESRRFRDSDFEWLKCGQFSVKIGFRVVLVRRLSNRDDRVVRHRDFSSERLCHPPPRSSSVYILESTIVIEMRSRQFSRFLENNHLKFSHCFCSDTTGPHPCSGLECAGCLEEGYQQTN